MQESSKIIHINQPLEGITKDIYNLLMSKDIWNIENDLGLEIPKYDYLTKDFVFDDIQLAWIKDFIKKYILYRAIQKLKSRTIYQDLFRLKRFAEFLQLKSIFSCNQINNTILVEYYDFLKNYCQFSDVNRSTYISSTKNFLDIGTINGWFSISTYILQKLGSKNNKLIKEINYIPDHIFRQLDENLIHLPPTLQRMVILLRTLGLRIGELLLLQFDCLHQKANNLWEIRFYNWKFKNRLNILPINEVLVAVIREQQEYIKKSLGENYQYLFCASSKLTKKIKENEDSELFHFEPIPEIMKVHYFNNCLNKLAKHYNICDLSGNLWHFSSHQFRRTVATKMVNENVRQYVIQMYLRHHSPDMMLHYAHLLPETAKKEIDNLYKQKKIVDVTGKIVESIHPELDTDIGLQWLRSKMQPKALAMGFCARPELLKPCPHANACMNCQHFRLDTDDIPALKQHRENTNRLKAESERLSYIRQVQELQKDEIKLDNLIKSLEAGND